MFKLETKKLKVSKELLKEDKLRFGLITLDLDNVKEFYDEKYLNYIFALSEEYIKNIKQIFNGNA